LNTGTQPDRESDAALLARFARLRDEAAFAELMKRHGPMVLAVGWRMLGQRQDAEDALQAVFLTVAVKARALRRVRSVAGWLHNVAVRISLNLLKMKRRREQGLRRFHKERGGRQESEPKIDSLAHDNPDELRQLLDEELAQLPARFKEAVILRDLQGYSRSEAAGILKVPGGTVDSRLSRGRKLLYDRLVRRGVKVGAGGLATTLAACAETTPAFGVDLIHETYRNAQLFLAGTAAGSLSAATNIGSLAQGVLNTMFLTKLSTTVCILALAAALVLGATPVTRMLELASTAQAQPYFEDSFEDGNVSDGIPVEWAEGARTDGTSQVIAGDYVLNGTSVSSYAVSGDVHVSVGA
jgi:RNA polymerase sigma factor (sigma-70 family)